MTLWEIIEKLQALHDGATFASAGDRNYANKLLCELSELDGRLERMSAPRTEIDVDGNEIPSYRIP